MRSTAVRRPRVQLVCVLPWVLLMACAARGPAPAPLPSTEHWVTAPEAPESAVSGPLLTHLLRGLNFLASGYPAAAVPHLRLALIYDPASPFIHERLAVAWAAAGDMERARAVLAAGLQKAPRAASLNAMQGELSRRALRFADARERFELALTDEAQWPEVGPGLVDVLLWLKDAEVTKRAQAFVTHDAGDARLALGVASAFEDHGELEQALAFYRKGRAQAPASESAALDETRVLSLLGRNAEAAEALTPLFAFYPDGIGIFLQMTRLLRRAQDPLAETYRREAMVQASGDPLTLTRIALADLHEGAVDEGRALLRDIVSKHADVPAARLFLAEVELHRGDPQACLSLLAPLLELSEAHVQRAHCALALGDVAQGLAEAERAVRSSDDPQRQLAAAAALLARYAGDEAEARAQVSQLFERLTPQLSFDDAALAEITLLDFFGHGKKALQLAERLVAERPDDLDLRLRWTDLTARYGDVAKAIEALSVFVEQEPDDPTRLNALGFTLADAGVRLDQAEVWLRRAYRMLPEQGFVVDSLGWLLYRQGKYRDALALLLRANAATPGDPEILLHLGETQRALGQHAQARASFEAALRAGPNVTLKRRLVARLGAKS